MSEALVSKVVATPLGSMIAVASGKGLCALEFEKEDRNKLLRTRLSRYFRGVEVAAGASPYLDDAAAWLAAYFAGPRMDLPKMNLDLRGTPFELKVWHGLLRLKLATTTSYARLADDVGHPKAYRAVGSASRRNPISLIVPCHRVLGSDGELRGYGGGLENKGWLIAFEQRLLQE